MIGARSVLVLIASITWVASGTVARANDEMLARAKTLYLNASYDEALTVLGQILGDPATALSGEAREYRLFCLIALDRTREARDVIELMVKADPFYEPSADQASPRVRSVFKDVRRVLLPAIVQQAYGDAKASFSRKDPQSTAQFERVLNLLTDPDVAALPSFADLRTVVAGFRDLSAATAVPAASPAVMPAPAVITERSDPAPAPPASFAQPDIVPPVALNQALPVLSLPAGLRLQDRQGMLEVVIDETGNVVSATLRQSFHPALDAQIVRAAMGWKYQPALRAGLPVQYVKFVAVRYDARN